MGCRDWCLRTSKILANILEKHWRLSQTLMLGLEFSHVVQRGLLYLSIVHRQKSGFILGEQARVQHLRLGAGWKGAG